MKIERITIWSKALPLAEPYWLSGGRLRFDQLDATFVRLETDAGLSGWGEGTPWGCTYLPAHGPGLRAGVATLAPAVLGRDPRALGALNRAMDAALPGHPYAKAPIDIACWDILGQASDAPLWRLMGADAPAEVALNSSIATGAPEEMVARIETARAAGYATHSAKLGGAEPALDIARIEAISAALRPGEKITYDINRAWTPGVAIEALNSVKARGWIEQPCETLEQCAHVARRVSQPIMLDECLHTFQDHLEAWRLGACEGVKVKPNRVGGLTKALQIRDLGVSVGWSMHIEEVGGTRLADMAAFHLAAATPDAHRLASWVAHAHLADDPMERQGLTIDRGVARLPSTPGLGVAPSPGSLGAPVAVYEV